MMKQRLPPTKFMLPRDSAYVRTLGYAFGLSSGMLAPAFYGQMPPEAPVKMKDSVSTNDFLQFEQLFTEGHELGFQFGKQAAGELIKVLISLSPELWWPICLSFAGERMVGEPYLPKSTPTQLDKHIQYGIDAFRCIYQRHLL